MKNNILFSATTISLFLSGALSAQTFMYQKMYGDTMYDSNGRGITMCPDGNYIVVGSAWRPNGTGNDIFVMKIEPDGDTLWTRTYGGAGNEFGWNATPTGAGFLVYGTTDSYTGSSDFLSITLNANGDTVNSAVYGGPQSDDCLEGRGSGVTAEGNYIFAGQTMSYGAGLYDAYLFKTDYTGSVLWSRTYGGMYSEQNGTVIQTSDLGFASLGYTTSFGVGSADLFLIKTDSLGNLLWSRCFGDTLGELGYGLIQTSDGGYLLTGLVLVSPTNYDIIVVKTDSLGNLMWNRQFDGGANEWGKGAIEISTGGYLIYGVTMSFGGGNQDMMIMKLDTSGNFMWSYAYGLFGNEMTGSAIETPDGGFMICGSGVPQFSNRNHVYIVKTDATGNSNCFDTYGLFSSVPTNVVQTNPAPTQGTGCTRMNDTLSIESGVPVATICFTIGMEEELYHNNIELYPSPVSAALNIRVAEFNTSPSCVIMNATGQVVHQSILTSRETQLDVSEYASGIYFCLIESADGIISSKKFIVD